MKSPAIALLFSLSLLHADSWPEDWPAGRVVWESNRSGAWRIYSKPLPDGETLQVTPEEEGHDHFAAQIDPSGNFMAYLSFPKGLDGYRKHAHHVRVRLRLLDLRTGGIRDLADNARPYGEHRAVVWIDGDTLVFLDGNYRTHRLRLSDGETELLVDTPPPGKSWDHGYLLDRHLRVAFSGLAGFHRYDPETRSVIPADERPGCQPFVTHDGVWGVWMLGMGGPLQRVHLATDHNETILRKNDPMLPTGRGYLYFPSISPCQRVLVIGASPNQHDHRTSDYDLFAFRLDPEELTPIGAPLRLTEDPATDRFPDVWMPMPATALTAPKESPSSTDSEEPPWPARPKGLVLAWEHGGGLRHVAHASGEAAVLQWDRKGRARWGATQALALEGGRAVSTSPLHAALDAIRAAGAMGLELHLFPREAPATEAATVLDLSNPREASPLLRLRQDGGRLTLDLGPDLGRAAIDLGPLEGQALHLALSIRQGLLLAYRDGVALPTLPLSGHGFDRWAHATLVLGAETDGGADWRGEIEGLTLYARALEADEVADNARQALRRRELRAAVARHEVEARLVSLSPVLALEQIAPYRELQVMAEYERVKTVSGPALPERFRVRHWAWLDGTRQALPAENPGDVARLALESFEAYPHLTRDYLSDELDLDVEVPVFLDVGL